MTYQLVTAFSFSIFLPAVMAVVFLKKIDSRYYPFLFCLWAGCLNEVLSFYLMRHHIYTTLNNNLYVLAESLLLAWYFKEAGIPESKTFFAALVLSLAAVWLVETFVFGKLLLNSTYFRIFYSFILVLLSIRLVNQILLSAQANLLTNPDFILCLCFVVYFTYKCLVQSFVIYGITRDLVFQKKIYDILIYVNLGVNLLYALAVLWMSRIKKYILPLW